MAMQQLQGSGAGQMSDLIDRLRYRAAARDDDLATEAADRIEALEAQEARIKTELAWMEERGRNSTSYGSHADAYEVAARHLRRALAPEQEK